MRARRAADRGCASASSDHAPAAVDDDGGVAAVGAGEVRLGRGPVAGQAAASAAAPASPAAPAQEASEEALAQLRAKARAVAALQKLFFEELALGKDASGAAASALLRLNELNELNGTNSASSGAAEFGVATTKGASASSSAVGTGIGPSPAATPVPPSRPSPVIGGPTRGRPNGMVRYRVAVNN